MGASLETFAKTNLFSVEKEVSNFNDIYNVARTASELHLPHASTFHNPPTTQDIFWSLPGLIQLPGATRRWGMLSTAREAVAGLYPHSHPLQERQWWASTSLPPPARETVVGLYPHSHPLQERQWWASTSLPPPARETVVGLYPHSHPLQERRWRASTLTPTPCKRGSGGPLPSLPPPAQLSAQVCGMQVPTFIEMTAIST